MLNMKKNNSMFNVHPEKNVSTTYFQFENSIFKVQDHSLTFKYIYIFK